MIFFPQLLTEGVQLKWDHWPPESSASATIKFQIGIVSFSLRFIVPNLGTPFRLKKNRDRPSPRVVIVGALRASAGLSFLGLFRSLFLTSSAFHCFKGES